MFAIFFCVQYSMHFKNFVLLLWLQVFKEMDYDFIATFTVSVEARNKCIFIPIRMSIFVLTIVLILIYYLISPNSDQYAYHPRASRTNFSDL